MVQWEGPYEVIHRNVILTWEPIATEAPAHARPNCCYGNKVQFIVKGEPFDKYPLAEHRDLNHVFPVLIIVGPRGSSRWYELSPGQVVYRNDRWWMERQGFANTRFAFWLNKHWPDGWE